MVVFNLIPCSLGHACVFLLGGPTRDTPPLPIILRSGDILVLSGDARRAFHGVPRIIENSLPDYLNQWDPLAEDLGVGDALDQQLARDFIQTARINVNARQVNFR